MHHHLHGKRVLITGAGRGIGWALVEKCVQAGALVVALSKTQNNLDQLKKEYPEVVTVACDLGDWQLTRTVVSRLGHFDCLINNAGATSLQQFMEVTSNDFDTVYSVNVKAVVNVSQAVCRQMISAGLGGSIVNISSQAADVPMLEHTVYCGTKAALKMLSLYMAKELAQYKIRVNCVSPTVVLTDMGRKAWSDPEKSAPMLQSIPLGRFAEVEDVTNAVLFLLSDDSVMINAANIPVDGGASGCN